MATKKSNTKTYQEQLIAQLTSPSRYPGLIFTPANLKTMQTTIKRALAENQRQCGFIRGMAKSIGLDPATDPVAATGENPYHPSSRLVLDSCRIVDVNDGSLYLDIWIYIGDAEAVYDSLVFEGAAAETLRILDKGRCERIEAQEEADKARYQALAKARRQAAGYPSRIWAWLTSQPLQA